MSVLESRKEILRLIKKPAFTEKVLASLLLLVKLNKSFIALIKMFMTSKRFFSDTCQEESSEWRFFLTSVKRTASKT